MMYFAKKWLDEKNARLESIPDIFSKQVSAYQRTLFSDLLKLMDLIQRDSSGNIIFNATNVTNLSVIDTIYFKLKDTILNSEYVKSVSDYAQEFNKQAQINDEYFKASFDEFTKSNAATATLQVAKKGAVEALLGSPMDANFLTPIKSLLEDAVASGSGWSDTVTVIRNFVEGNEDADGRLLQYAKQIAKDEFSIADRTYANAIANELEVEFYLYSGQELPTSRCFCLKRHGKYFHYKEVQAWGEGKNLGECNTGEGTWAGMHRGTNKDTIFQYAGGYGCNHTIMPVSMFIVPKEDIKRNIQNGNFNPTAKELEQLGMA